MAVLPGSPTCRHPTTRSTSAGSMTPRAPRRCHAKSSPGLRKSPYARPRSRPPRTQRTRCRRSTSPITSLASVISPTSRASASPTNTPSLSPIHGVRARRKIPCGESRASRTISTRATFSCSKASSTRRAPCSRRCSKRYPNHPLVTAKLRDLEAMEPVAASPDAHDGVDDTSLQGDAPPLEPLPTQNALSAQLPTDLPGSGEMQAVIADTPSGEPVEVHATRCHRARCLCRRLRDALRSRHRLQRDGPHRRRYRRVSASA